MPANPILLSESDLRPLLEDPGSMDTAIDAMERATVQFHQGRVRDQGFSDRTQADPPNVVQLRFAADDAVCGYQMFAETPEGPELVNGRFVTLLDHETRQLLALVDYHRLSPIRVGATGGIGVRRLAPPGARIAGVLGSGRQARGQLQAIRSSVPTLERARVYSPTVANRETFAREMTDWLGLPVEAVASAREALNGADVIAVANSSGAPIFELSWVKAGALIVSVGGSQVPPEVMDNARIIATTWELLAGRRPYAERVKAGTYSKQDIGAELGPLILGEAGGRADPQQIVVFELGVINIWGVAAAQWAYEWALQHGAGTPFTLNGE